MTPDTQPVFTRCARTRGRLLSSFVFESDEALERWKREELPALCQEFGPLELLVDELPGLKLGESCFVYGEGDKRFVIEELVQWQPHRWGFVLDAGWVEEVAKCYERIIE